MSPLRAVTAALLLLTTCVVASCREPDAGLHVEIDGPLTPGVDFDRLTVVAYLAADRTPLYSEALDAPALPVTFNLVSGKGTPEGTEVEVLASAERAGEVVSAARGTATLQANEGGTLTLTLPEVPQKPDGGIAEACDDGVDDDGDGLADCADTADCDGKPCGAGGMTCRMGACGCANGTLGVWSTPSPGFLARAGARAITLTRGPYNGAVAIAGGVDELGAPSDAVELYRPGLSLDIVAVKAARAEPTLFTDADGNVFVAGGDPSTNLPLEAVDFDQLATTQHPITPPLPFAGARVLPFGDGWLLVGGTLGKAVYALSPPANGGTAWSAKPFATLATSRSDAVVLEDGRVFFASGPNATDTTELLSADGSVAVGPRLPVAVADAALAPLPGGRALVLGGVVTGSASKSAYVASVTGTSVSLRKVGDLSSARKAPQAYALGNGWVYVESVDAPAGEWFDFGSERFVPATEPNVPSTNAAIAPFKARLFRVGGAGVTGTGVGAFLDLECAP